MNLLGVYRPQTLQNPRQLLAIQGSDHGLRPLLPSRF